MTWPYLYSTKGTGTNVKARKAGMLLAQWIPRLRYMTSAKRGKAKPKSERNMVFEQRADAE